MSGLSDDTLRKILEQIQGQAIQSQKQLSVVKAQIQSRERERKILTISSRELDAIPKDDARMFKAVGKMFMYQPRAEIDGARNKQEKDLAEELSTLGKKEKYLQKQFDEANSQLRDIFHSQQRAAAAAQ